MKGLPPDRRSRSAQVSISLPSATRPRSAIARATADQVLAAAVERAIQAMP
jgi:hypothetical protein